MTFQFPLPRHTRFAAQIFTSLPSASLHATNFFKAIASLLKDERHAKVNNIFLQKIHTGMSLTDSSRINCFRKFDLSIVNRANRACMYD